MKFTKKLELLGYVVVPLLLVLSLAISYVVFAPVNAVSDTFVTNLLTVDSLSIAVVGIVLPIAIRTMRVEETQKELEKLEAPIAKSAKDRYSKDPSDTKFLVLSAVLIFLIRLSSFGLAAVMLIAPIIFITPFAVSILLDLTASLRSGNSAVDFAFVSLAFTVLGYLMILTAVFFLLWLLWQFKIGEFSRFESDNPPEQP